MKQSEPQYLPAAMQMRIVYVDKDQTCICWQPAVSDYGADYQAPTGSFLSTINNQCHLEVCDSFVLTTEHNKFTDIISSSLLYQLFCVSWWIISVTWRFFFFVWTTEPNNFTDISSSLLYQFLCLYDENSVSLWSLWSAKLTTHSNKFANTLSYYCEGEYC